MVSRQASYTARIQSSRAIVPGCALYAGDGFLVTVLANVPPNEGLARVAPNAPADELARARAAY